MKYYFKILMKEGQNEEIIRLSQTLLINLWLVD